MKRKAKKSLKNRIFKASQGVISILLCILVTPFLTIAGALVELSRYQNAQETMQELIDSSMLSTLADYDKYLEERFGLFSVDQEVDISSSFASYLDNNKNVLGGAISLETPITTGKLSLTNQDVITSQLLDFSESTAFTEMLLENFNLQEIIDELDNLTAIKDLSDITDKISNVTSDLEDAVEKSKAVKNAAEDIVSDIHDLKSSFKTLYNDVNSFKNSLSDNKYTLISQYNSETKIHEYKFQFVNNDGEEEIIEISDVLFDNEYKVYFNNLNSDYKSISNKINDLISKIDSFPGKVTDFQTAVTKLKNDMNDAQSKSDSLSNSDNAEEGAAGKSASKTLGILDTIIQELETALDDTINTFKDDMVSAVKNSLNELRDNLKKDFPSTKVSDWELNIDAERIAEILYDFFQTNNASELVNRLADSLLPENVKEMFSSVTSIKDALGGAISAAENKLKEEAQKALKNALSSLVKAIKGLFDLDVFYNDEMTEYLNDTINSLLLSENNKNPYATFLEGITDLFKAINDFNDSVGKWNFIKCLKALGDIFKNIGKVLSSAVYLTNNMVEKMKNMVSMFTSDSVSLYDFLLISAYMVNNLPNRTTSSDEIGLTGFKYSDIVGAFSNGGTADAPQSGIKGLTSFLSEDPTGGNDGASYFDGAELEYIVAGTRSEVMNQVVAFMQLYFIRLILDIKAVFSDPSVASMATAANIVSWVVYILVLLGEPLCDCIMLVNPVDNGGCYLLKNRCYLSPAGISNLISDIAKRAISNENLKLSVLDSVSDGLPDVKDDDKWTVPDGGGIPNTRFDYEDHMLLALAFFTSGDDMITRFQNLVQIEAYNYYNKADNGGYIFNIRNAYAVIHTDVKVTFNPFLSILQSNDSSLFSVNYSQDRGY